MEADSLQSPLGDEAFVCAWPAEGSLKPAGLELLEILRARGHRGEELPNVSLETVFEQQTIVLAEGGSGEVRREVSQQLGGDRDDRWYDLRFEPEADRVRGPEQAERRRTSPGGAALNSTSPCAGRSSMAKRLRGACRRYAEADLGEAQCAVLLDFGCGHGGLVRDRHEGHQSGYSASQWVQPTVSTGVLGRPPMGRLSEDSRAKASEEFVHRLALLEAVQAGFVRLHFSGRRARVTPTSLEMNIGDLRYLWAQLASRRGSNRRIRLTLRQWHGLGIVLATEGRWAIYAGYRGRCTKRAPEAVRPASTTERLATTSRAQALKEVLSEAERPYVLPGEIGDRARADQAGDLADHESRARDGLLDPLAVALHWPDGPPPTTEVPVPPIPAPRAQTDDRDALGDHGAPRAIDSGAAVVVAVAGRNPCVSAWRLRAAPLRRWP